MVRKWSSSLNGFEQFLIGTELEDDEESEKW